MQETLTLTVGNLSRGGGTCTALRYRMEHPHKAKEHPTQRVMLSKRTSSGWMIPCNVPQRPHRLLPDLLRWRRQDAHKDGDGATLYYIAGMLCCPGGYLHAAICCSAHSSSLALPCTPNM